MTKAEAVRTQVLKLVDQGMSEIEIALAAGITEDRVLKILEVIEAPVERLALPPVKVERVPTMPRSVHRSVKFKVQPDSAAAKQWAAGTRKRTTPPAEHGTMSGYNAHLRIDPAGTCDPCREAARLRSENRRRLSGSLTAEERAAVIAQRRADVQVLHREGLSTRQIAERMDMPKSTVVEDLRRYRQTAAT